MPSLSKNLNENIQILDKRFKNASDFTKLALKIDNIDAVLLSLEGQIDRQYVSVSALRPMSNIEIGSLRGGDLVNFVSENVLRVIDQIKINTIEDLITKLMLGFAVILMDSCDTAISFGGQGFKTRSVENPDNENMLRGSKEGFVEAVQINVSLIRRRMRNTDLKFERMTIGKESMTPIMISYIENRVSKKILNKLKSELKNINLKTVMAAGYLTGYLNKGGVFGTVGTTERPDTACAKMEEGRVAIIVDGTPTVLIVPYLFTENFQNMDDYATKPIYASYIRYIKYLCFFISAFVPALYVGIITGRPELIPDEILVKIAIAESGTPLNIFWEIILANLLYEIMREAGLRAPKVFGQSV
ncbi:MAG: spore germination protein, partial [Clostridia bacterium]